MAIRRIFRFLETTNAYDPDSISKILLKTCAADLKAWCTVQKITMPLNQDTQMTNASNPHHCSSKLSIFYCSFSTQYIALMFTLLFFATRNHLFLVEVSTIPSIRILSCFFSTLHKVEFDNKGFDILWINSDK